MTVRELMQALLREPIDAEVYIGKGMGPCRDVRHVAHGQIVVMLSPQEPKEAS